MNYSAFCKVLHTSLTSAEYIPEEEIPATDDELQWTKGYGVLHALRDKGAGNATAAELLLVRAKTNRVITNPEIRRALAKEF